MTDHTPEPDSVREAFEAVAWRTRYRSEPGMLGNYPWTYTDHKPRGERPEYEREELCSLAAAQSRIASLEAERDEWKSIAEHNLSRRLSALEERNAAVTARDEALARVASLEQAMREVLEFQSAPEGPHISEWGRWRRLIDGSKWVERAGLSTTSTANQAACRQQNAIHEPQAGLSLTGEPAGAEGQTP